MSAHERIIDTVSTAWRYVLFTGLPPVLLALPSHAHRRASRHRTSIASRSPPEPLSRWPGFSWCSRNGRAPTSAALQEISLGVQPDLATRQRTPPLTDPDAGQFVWMALPC